MASLPRSSPRSRSSRSRGDPARGIDFSGAHWLGFVVLLFVGRWPARPSGCCSDRRRAAEINVMFASCDAALFTGPTFYPWQALASLRWFQVVTLVNPRPTCRRACAARSTAPSLGAGWVALGLAVATATVRISVCALRRAARWIQRARAATPRAARRGLSFGMSHAPSERHTPSPRVYAGHRAPCAAGCRSGRRPARSARRRRRRRQASR